MHVEIWVGCKFVGHEDGGILIWWGRDTDSEEGFLLITEPSSFE
jgi:hypothetical protein